MYWDINRCLSYNCLFNFIVGARGVGKTYGAKRYVIKKYLKNKEQFVYVRRYKDELKKMKRFFDDIEREFPDVEFKVSPPNFIINDEVAGTYMPLSTAKIEKSTPFPRVKTIIFDEFILDRGTHHYLPDEVTNFLELYSTVARDRDVRVLFLSNALTQTNPYFLYFDVHLPYGKNIYSKNDILIEMVVDEEYKQHMEQTRFGKLIAGTEYGNYNMGNEFLRDDTTFIEKKPDTVVYSFTMKYKDTYYGVWVDRMTGFLYVSYDVDSSSNYCYAVTQSDHQPNMVLLKGHISPLFDRFLLYYKRGYARFEDMNIKNLCQEILKLTL